MAGKLSAAQQRLLTTLQERPGLYIIRRPFTKKTALSDPMIHINWCTRYGGLSWSTVQALVTAGHLRKERVSSAQHRYHLVG